MTARKTSLWCIFVLLAVVIGVLFPQHKFTCIGFIWGLLVARAVDSLVGDNDE